VFLIAAIQASELGPDVSYPDCGVSFPDGTSKYVKAIYLQNFPIHNSIIVHPFDGLG
jgi:hypothetical protein